MGGCRWWDAIRTHWGHLDALACTKLGLLRSQQVRRGRYWRPTDQSVLSICARNVWHRRRSGGIDAQTRCGGERLKYLAARFWRRPGYPRFLAGGRPHRVFFLGGDFLVSRHAVGLSKLLAACPTRP